MRILIAPNSMKGTIDAFDFAGAGPCQAADLPGMAFIEQKRLQAGVSVR